MNSLSSRDRVVDQLVTQLAQRRALRNARRAGYVALLRSALSDEQPPRLGASAFERQSLSLLPPAQAA